MTKKSRRNRNQHRSEHEERNVGKQHVSKSKLAISRENILVAATMVGIAYLALPLLVGPRELPQYNKVPTFKAEDFIKSSAESIEERLMDEWQPGDAVTIKKIEEGNRGLFATRNVQRGEVIARVHYPDLEAEINREYPSLKSTVQTALSSAIQMQGDSKWVTLTGGKVLSLIKFLMEDSMGEESIWNSFIESVPNNLTNMAWYWSEEERKCVVPRPSGSSLDLDLQVYHSVMEKVKDRFRPLAEIYTRQRVEWAYLTLKTRGFGQYFFPVLHLANHNPLEAVPAFLIPSADTAVYVATQEIKEGDPVYASYGTMTPVVTAEQYGFVDPSSVYFEVPSILEDILQSDRTKNEPLCNAEPAIFFGSVPTKTVGVNFKNTGKQTYFKAFMPDERTYACIRVLLQSERDTDVASYIAEKLEMDYKSYKAMANAPHCQSDEGNFPLIRQANTVMKRMFWGALDVAKQGKDYKIPYPGIPTYKSNYE